MTKTTRKSVLSALILGAFALFAVPAARAQLTFTVDEFTADRLVVTINPGTLLTTDGGGSFIVGLTLVDADKANTNWVNFESNGSGGGMFGSANLQLSKAFTNPATPNDLLAFAWDRNLSTSGNLVTGLTFTFQAAGLFNPANVSNLALYWGFAPNPPATLQSVSSTTSPIPEPSTFAALAGLAVLGLATTRRRSPRA